MIITVLGSGSKGNCTLVHSGGTRLLLDAGLSCKQIEIRLGECGILPIEINGILVTHEHGDHINGLPTFCHKHGIDAYMSEGTASALREKVHANCINIFKPGVPFRIGSLTVQAEEVPHEAAHPVCFFVTDDHNIMGYLTDLGHVDVELMHLVKRCNALVIESNYDPEMMNIDSVSRPWATNNRNSGRAGHLSNKEAAAVLSAAAREPFLRFVVLAHLSRTFNTPELALEAVSQVLNGIPVRCASQDLVTDPVVL